MGEAFIYLQLQGDSQFLLKGEGNPLFSSPEPDISEMCAGHPADTSRLGSPFETEGSSPACISFPCASRIYFIAYERCGGEV